MGAGDHMLGPHRAGVLWRHSLETGSGARHLLRILHDNNSDYSELHLRQPRQRHLGDDHLAVCGGVVHHLRRHQLPDVRQRDEGGAAGGGGGGGAAQRPRLLRRLRPVVAVGPRLTPHAQRSTLTGARSDASKATPPHLTTAADPPAFETRSLSSETQRLQTHKEEARGFPSKRKQCAIIGASDCQ